jgi:hypothetical protein
LAAPGRTLNPPERLHLARGSIRGPHITEQLALGFLFVPRGPLDVARHGRRNRKRDHFGRASHDGEAAPESRKLWYANVQSVDAPDPAAVLFRLTRPQPSLLMLLASGYSPIYPAHVPPAELRTRCVGTPEPYPSWGRMLSVSATEFAQWAPWLVVFPGLAISLVVFASNLFGDGLYDRDGAHSRPHVQRVSASASCSSHSSTAARTIS